MKRLRFPSIAVTLATMMVALLISANVLHAGTYTPDTREKQVRRTERAMASMASQERNQANRPGGDRFTGGTRWAGGLPGEPQVITVSFVPDGLSIPSLFGEGAGVSSLFTTLDGQFGGMQNRGDWQDLFEEAFAHWEAVCGVRFQFISDPNNTNPTVNFWDDGFQWGAPGPIDDPGNERQRVSLSGTPTGGNFTLSFQGDTTGNIAFNASALVVQGALEALASVGPGNVAVSGNAGGPWLVEFIGALAGANFPAMVGTSNLTPSGSVIVEEFPGSGFRGDIRIGMKSFIDGPGGLCALATDPAPGFQGPGTFFNGDIILDSNENWADGQNEFRFFVNCVAREIGTAIGLKPACPRDGSKLMESVLNLGFEGPQLDDIRAANFLYGDWLVQVNTSTGGLAGNNTLGNAFFFDETDLMSGEVLIDNISIDQAGEMDYFGFTVPDSGNPDQEGARIFITLTPIGEEYNFSDQNADGSCPSGAPIDALAIQNLKVSLLDADGFVISTTDATPIGEAETAEFVIMDPGTYFILAEGDNINNDVQLYQLFGFLDEGTTPDFARVEQVGDIPDRIGANFLTQLGFDGSRARIHNVDGGLAWDGHVVFFGRDVPTVVWDGAEPSVDQVTPHATAILATAGGGSFDQFGSIAPGAHLMSGSIGRQLLNDNVFIPSISALMFNLFGVVDQGVQAQLGLDGSPTVVCMPWTLLGDTLGEGTTSRVVDAFVHQTGIPVVCAAGDSGLVANTASCEGQGGDDVVGGAFAGARTVGAPGSAWNAITVGWTGIQWAASSEGTGMSDSRLFPDRIVSASSRGPLDAFNYDPDEFDEEENSRPGIHLVAPGTGLAEQVQVFCPPYDGHWRNSRRLNVPWIDPMDDPQNPTDATFFSAELAENFPPGPGIPPPDGGGKDGASVAAGVVAGAIALLQDAGMAHGLATNSLVMKAVLMTGATKLPGWTNRDAPGSPQDLLDGRAPSAGEVFGQFLDRQRTTQVLDYAQGAGTLDLRRTSELYLGVVPTDPNGTLTLTDSPLTDPNRPTVTFVEVVLPPIIPTAQNSPESDVLNLEPEFQLASLDSSGSEFFGDALSPVEVASVLRKSYLSANESAFARSLQFGQQTDPSLTGGRPATGAGGDAAPAVIITPPKKINRRRLRGVGQDINAIGDNPLVIPMGSIYGGRHGWDHGNLGMRLIEGQNSGQVGYIDYVVGPIGCGRGRAEVLTATLVWDRKMETKPLKFRGKKSKRPLTPTYTALELEDLDLQLFRSDVTGRVQGDAIFESVSRHNNVEHIFYPLDAGIQNAFFVLRVNWDSRIYDLFLNEVPASVPFALAWRTDMYEERLLIDGRNSGTSGLRRWRQCAELDVRPPTTPPSAPATLGAIIPSFGTSVDQLGFNYEADLTGDGTVDTQDLLRALNLILDHNTQFAQP